MSKYVWYDFKEGYHVRCVFFGIIDIIIGIIIFLSNRYVFTENVFIIGLSFLYFILAFSSLIRSFSKRYFYDWRGYFDVISAVVLLSIYYGNVPNFFQVFGIVVILKGFICVLIPTTKEY